ncbi:hypothetical protein CASFOL_004941 [Castilleja foliolosa]|uniref:Uncharacterized protein n=1 Tax=Castilleja foliolosa TaxID=1961234 RepID=A0ABD3EFK7_9LAMI
MFNLRLQLLLMVLDGIRLLLHKFYLLTEQLLLLQALAGGKVIVRGEKADPLKVLERVQRKSHRQALLISPIPKPPADELKKTEDKEVDKVEEKKEELIVITAVLGVYMHCEACAQEIKKRILRMKDLLLSVAVDPSNTWFCTGSADRTIKIWDLASGRLKLTLTCHIDQVRGLAISSKHTYMFSAGDDKLVKCWDLEQNKVIRSYDGHLSSVYSLALHPTIDVLLTGGCGTFAAKCKFAHCLDTRIQFVRSSHDLREIADVEEEEISDVESEEEVDDESEKVKGTRVLFKSTIPIWRSQRTWKRVMLICKFSACIISKSEFSSQ